MELYIQETAESAAYSMPLVTHVHIPECMHTTCTFQELGSAISVAFTEAFQLHFPETTCLPPWIYSFQHTTLVPWDHHLVFL
jgi:hypothetical protein